MDKVKLIYKDYVVEVDFLKVCNQSKTFLSYLKLDQEKKVEITLNDEDAIDDLAFFFENSKLPKNVKNKNGLENIADYMCIERLKEEIHYLYGPSFYTIEKLFGKKIFDDNDYYDHLLYKINQEKPLIKLYKGDLILFDKEYFFYDGERFIQHFVADYDPYYDHRKINNQQSVPVCFFDDFDFMYWKDHFNFVHFDFSKYKPEMVVNLELVDQTWRSSFIKNGKKMTVFISSAQESSYMMKQDIAIMNPIKEIMYKKEHLLEYEGFVEGECILLVVPEF